MIQAQTPRPEPKPLARKLFATNDEQKEQGKQWLADRSSEHRQKDASFKNRFVYDERNIIFPSLYTDADKQAAEILANLPITR